MSFPYDEAREIFNEWVLDLVNPVNPEAKITVKCPICYEDIEMSADSVEDIYSDGCRSYSDIYHKSCLHNFINFETAFKFLDKENELKEFLNWLYADEMCDKPIDELTYRLKTALINDVIENGDKGLKLVREYIEDYLIEEFVRWANENKEI